MTPYSSALACLIVALSLTTVSVAANDVSRKASQRCPAFEEKPDFDPTSLSSMRHTLRNAPRIFYSLGKDRRPMLKQMLSAGENPNVCAIGASILNLSVVTGDLDEIRLLLENGAHPDLPLDEDGGSPLHTALAYGKFDVARLLLSKGASPRRAKDGGHTSLHELAIAVIQNESSSRLQQKLAEEFIALGVPINAQNAPGSTALMLAVAARNQHLVVLLMRLGADPDIRNKRGDTAKTLARRLGDPALMSILEGRS